MMNRDNFSLYNAGFVPVEAPELSGRQNQIALARADLLRVYLEEKKRAKSNKRSVCGAAGIFITGYNTGQLMPKIYKILGAVSKQNVERWGKIFRDANYDYVALAPKWGHRKGYRKVSDDEFKALLSFALHPSRLKNAEVTRRTKRALKRRGVSSPSSSATLRRALKKWRETYEDQRVFHR